MQRQTTQCSVIFTASHSAQTAAQVTIATCHEMDIQMPYGQAYNTKTSSLRIYDHHFGPSGCHYVLTSQVGYLNHCCHAEMVDFVDCATSAVSVG